MQEAGEQGVLLVSLGTVAELSELLPYPHFSCLVQNFLSRMPKRLSTLRCLQPIPYAVCLIVCVSTYFLPKGQQLCPEHAHYLQAS